ASTWAIAWHDPSTVRLPPLENSLRDLVVRVKRVPGAVSSVRGRYGDACTRRRARGWRRVSPRAGDQHRHVELMPHPVDGLAEEQVPHQAVTMRTDDQEIHGIFPEVADELARGVGAVQQNRAGTIAALAQGLNQLVQVTCICPGFPVGGVGAVDTRNR